MRAAIERRVRAGVDPALSRELLARIDRHLPDAVEALAGVYGAEHDLDALLERLVVIVTDAAGARPDELRLLDRRRESSPDWFQSERMVGYMTYVDRFSGRLPDVSRQLDYLEELGVTYLHLMPLLRPRPGPNDGGYAVADYREVDERLGSIHDLEALARDLRAREISLCTDFVVNHTAREHKWARAAIEGDPHFRDFYYVFPDRTLPDAYERTLPDVFPASAPGSFVWVEELAGWVWSTFHDYQWDLNYGNPDVFAGMLEKLLYLAGKGVEVFRLDAVPFLWKRLGTDCQNQPEVDLLLQALRALLAIAAPASIFKAEAIVPSDQLIRYLGGDSERPECDLAYNNQLMVMLWSALATRETALTEQALRRMRPLPPGTAWVTYVRCHDDIGWAVADEDAGAAGLDGFWHRRFLADFYSGEFPLSFARGAVFQANPETGDARISGSAAALCGVEQALELGDDALLEQALRRLVLLYGVVFSYGGIPLVYMGDELALGNDYSYRDDPARADDNRWLHRPYMDWAAAARRSDPDTLEGRVFGAIQRLARARASLPALHAGTRVELVETDNPRVLAYARVRHGHARFLCLASFSDVAESCDARVIADAGLRHPLPALTENGRFELGADRIELPPLGLLWLRDE